MLWSDYDVQVIDSFWSVQLPRVFFPGTRGWVKGRFKQALLSTTLTMLNHANPQSAQKNY